jgi:predicted RND superfamily exporter protein
MAPDILVSRKERTRYAILHIGPSIIGSAFTTLSTSIIMMFTENEFYRKFGTMLIVTILQALIGSFVVFFGLSIV